MGRLRAKSDYEDLRNARILENQARLKSLGLQETISELRSIVSSAKPSKTHVRNWTKKVYDMSSLRRSGRLKQMPPEVILKQNTLRRSSRLRGNTFTCQTISGEPCDILKASQRTPRASQRTPREKLRPANMPLVEIKGLQPQLSPEASAIRCSSKSRGSVYNPVFGICCHFCRQKKLCGEEDCKRCSNFDVDEPCIGKTDCSVCHSSNGVLCRACLKVRYGEEMEEVRKNKNWMCPHCIEEKGIKPHWICNSSFCLKKRKMAPTGIAIYRAQELGYKSVAHLLMDELQGAINRRGRKI